MTQIVISSSDPAEFLAQTQTKSQQEEEILIKMILQYS